MVVVSIRATNYGQAGGVTETLPSGFSYVSSSLRASQVTESGQNVRFTLQGDTSFDLHRYGLQHTEFLHLLRYLAGLRQDRPHRRLPLRGHG